MLQVAQQDTYLGSPNPAPNWVPNSGAAQNLPQDGAYSNKSPTKVANNWD